MLERSLQHPNPRVQVYVAKLIYQGERARAASRLAWGRDEPPSELVSARDAQVLLEADLEVVFGAMEASNYFEPADEELEQALHGGLTSSE